MAVAVALAVPLPHNAVTALGWHWRSWTVDGRSDRYASPEDNDRPAAYAKLTVRVPLAGRRLPEPRYHGSGKPHLETAKEAVHLAVVQLNGALGELLGRLSTRRAA